MDKDKIEMSDFYLADNLLRIELWIGSDLLWEFLLYERISINTCLCAIKAVLRWVNSRCSFK